MADEGIKTGEAYVEVSLRLKSDAWTRLTADNNAAAAKSGDTLGDRIGAAIAKKIATAVKDGLTAGGTGVGAQGAKQGEDFGGKFAEVVKTRIEAALKSLPRADISLGTADADAKLRDLRTRLEELSGKQVGVDIRAEDALAEIRDIKAKLDELGARSPSIQVKTDTAAASAQLAAVQAQVNKLNGANANVGVKTNADQEAQKVFTLANAIILLGPAAVPSAAAAAAAILGIGAAATSVFAAIGVGKLAFQGIGGALTAIDNAQQGAAKSGATLAQQQAQLASGADSVKSAEASLANTRASAAASLRSANQQIGNSEQTLADAERAELRAQQDLTLARQDAKRSIEDLNTQVADGALQQRQAALDLDKARIALAAINAAGSNATADQRAQAQLTYDQAVQQVTDLSIRQQRAIQDRDAANKAGVEGSKQVTAAQESLLSANEKVGNAEQGVANARQAAADAARQAAFSIAQAQQSVVSSQRAMQQALVSTSVTGGAATDALRLALSKLSPEGQKFAYFLYSLKPQLDQLKQSAQAGLFPGLQSGITTLLPYFGQLDRFVGNVATELGHLGTEAAHTFTDPFWRSFFGFIGNQAVPNLDMMFHSILNIAGGGARIIQAFGPVEQQVGGIILGLTQKFLTFSQGLDHNQGFQSFIRYVETETPHVISTIEALGTAGLHIIQAYAPIGSVVVSDIKLLSDIIGAIPVPVVTALAAAFTAYRIASALSTLATQGLGSSLVGTIAKMVTYGTATNVAGVQTTGLQRAVTGAKNVIGSGGFTFALAGAAILISAIAEDAANTKAKIDALQSSAADYAQTLKGGLNPASVQQAATLLQQNSALRGLVETTGQLGISTQTLVSGLNGDKAARTDVIDTINAEIDRRQHLKGLTSKQEADNLKEVTSLVEMRIAFAKQNTAMADTADLQKRLAGEQPTVTDAFGATAKTLGNAAASADDFKTAIAQVGAITADVGPNKVAVFAGIADRVAASSVNATDKATLFGQILQGIGESAGTSGPTFDALNGTFESIAHSALDAHDKVNLLKQALTQAYGPAQDLNAANENLATTQASLVTQIGHNNAGFNLNTALSGKNTDAIVGNRKALEAALTAAQDKYVQDLANNVSETDARTAHDKTVASILAGIPTRQRDTQEVKNLVKEYGDIPPYRETDIKTTGADAVLQQLQDLKVAQYALQFNVTTTEARNALAGTDSTFKSQVPAAARATGGPISGPGTSTSDSIPAIGPDGSQYKLSAGEWIHQASAVDYYGQNLMAAINAKAIPREALEQRRASGGPVTWPFNVDVLKTFLPQVSPLTGASGTGDLNVAGTIYQVAQALKADHKVLLSAFETALVESGMRNLKVAVDHDSLGVFQQRPSQGWGTPAQLTNVAYAAHAYLTRAIANEPGFAKGSAGQLAQSVQRSAFPDRYDQRQSAAEALIAKLAGGGAGGAAGGAARSAIGSTGGSALGGILGSIGPFFNDSGVNPAKIAGIKNFLHSVDPLPYSFGAVGPKAFDCSGLVGEVWAQLTGHPSDRRYFTTFDFAGGAPGGFKQGANGGTLAIGVDPTVHMAGNFDGLPFEAKSTQKGIVVGNGVTPVSAFPKQFHLAQGGPVDASILERLGLDVGGDPSGITVDGKRIPRQLFDTGGWLMPGLTLADNRTGSPELVHTPAQTANSGPTSFNVILEAADPAVRDLMKLIDVRVEAGHDRVAAAVGSGVRDF